MKINLPVTGQERLFPSDRTLVSKTDTKGVITFANSDFLEVSGFSDEELIGTSHNIIRHPDMPAVAFEVMWKTLQLGLPWHGIVKNRCKNGDFYWVDAKVVPIRKSGQTIGYMSVRTCPSREDIARAEAAYKTAATAPQTIREPAVSTWKKHLSIKNGIPVWILFVTLMMIAGGILGITGLNLSNSAIQSLYYEEMDPVQSIGRINFLMADNRAQVTLALHHNPATYPDLVHDHPVTSHLQTLVKNKEEIDRLWNPYAEQIKNPEEKELAEKYWQARNSYVQQGLLKAKQAIEADDYSQAELVLFNNVIPLYDKANTSVSVLLKHLSDRGLARFSAVTKRNQIIAKVAIAGIVMGCLVLIICGIFFFRFTVTPLHKAVVALEEIAEGNLKGDVATGGFGEPERVMSAVTIMQMHLKVMMHEIKRSSSSIRQQCFNLNQVMMNLAEHSDEQHDRVYQTLDAISDASTALNALATDAESLIHAGGADDDTLATAVAADTQPAGLEPMPSELLALFGENAAQSAVGGEGGSSATTSANSVSPPAQQQRAGDDSMTKAEAVAGTARVQAFAVQDAAAQLTQIAGLIVQSREEVQGAWAASQKLQKTAVELDNLVKYFE